MIINVTDYDKTHIDDQFCWRAVVVVASQHHLGPQETVSQVWKSPSGAKLHLNTCFAKFVNLNFGGFVFSSYIPFSAWKRPEVGRSMWTSTRKRTCDSEQPVIDSLNTCDPVKLLHQAVTFLRTFVIRCSVVGCPRGPFSPSPERSDPRKAN